MDSERTPGKALRTLRTTFGLTLDNLAKKTGIMKQNLSAMETGHRKIGRAAAQKLAKALGTSYQMFVPED